MFGADNTCIPLTHFISKVGMGGDSSNGSDNAHHSSLQPDRVEILRALLWSFLCGGPHIIYTYVFSVLSLLRVV